MKFRYLIIILILGTVHAVAQDTLSIDLESVKYPYPVRFMPLQTEGQDVRMAYMDVRPATPNGKTFILFHGKNFGGYYWTNVITALVQNGYRVIVPDQIGFGKSSKPFIHYSFHALARWDRQLMDTLGVSKVYVLGHSMGGMLATRFSLMYPEMVQQLFLENPIGLEDYRSFVPYRSAEDDYKTELKTTAASVRKYYQGSYFTQWKPEYDELVRIGSAVSNSAEFPRWAKVAAMTYEMIYEQPVCYEFGLLKVPTVLLIGQLDNTIVGKALLSEAEQSKHGRYAELGPATAKKIPDAKLIMFPQTKHIPHIEVKDEFLKSLLGSIR